MTKPRAHGDVFQVYASLSDKQRQFLLGVACHYWGGTSFGEPLELLHEALIRTALGRRRWALRMNFSAHMALTMRSVADADRRLHTHSRTAGAAFEEIVEWAADSLGMHPSAEVECAKNQEILDLRSKIARAKIQWEACGDGYASSVLDGMLADLDEEEIAERLGIARGAVRSARKRILRKLSSLGTL